MGSKQSYPCVIVCVLIFDIQFNLKVWVPLTSVVCYFSPRLYSTLRLKLCDAEDSSLCAFCILICGLPVSLFYRLSLVFYWHRYFFLFTRRLAFTADPNWPAVKLSGSLPQLVVHIDEQKVFQFNCFFIDFNTHCYPLDFHCVS